MPAWMNEQVYRSHTEQYEWKQEAFEARDDGLRAELAVEATRHLHSDPAAGSYLLPVD